MKKELVNLSISSIATFVTYLIGGIDAPIKILGIMIVLDFITGILSAIYNRELESRACLKGIIKKSCYFLLVIVAHGLDTLVPNDGTFLLRTITIYFLVANDGLSILENVGECGVEYPNFLKNFLKQLRTKADEGDIQEKVEEPEVEEKELFDSTYKALFPCEEGGITIKYSNSHKGIDVGWIAIENCKVISVDDGVVVQAESYTTGGDRGEYCVIEHSDGKHKYWTGYLHLLENSLKVKQGDVVKKGDLLGKRGNTGLSNGTHLHLYMSDFVSLDTQYSYNTMKNHCTFDPLTRLYKLKGSNISAKIEER